VNLERFRIGQRLAYDVCLTRFASRESYTTIVVPTRYGKSDLMRCIAYTATADRIISGAIAFTPFQTLTTQLVAKKKVLEMALRYGLEDDSRVTNVRQLISFSEHQPFSNGEYLLAANMQLAMRDNISLFRDLVDHQRYETGLPLALFFDECQFISEQKRWGEFVHIAADMGCVLALMTATAIRDDGDEIPGFYRERLARTDEERYRVYDAGDGKQNWRERWIGGRELYKLTAHHTTTFKDAWDENPSPLCHLSREIIDIEVDHRGETSRLSELSPSLARTLLPDITRDPDFVERAVRKFLELLRDMQTVNSRCAGIVLTGSDRLRSGRDNEHAEAVKDVILQCGEAYLGKRPVVQIVTMKTTEDQRPADRLAQFVSGAGDALIVKVMGAAGLDAERLKVMLDLSTVRTVAAKVQAWMRVATPMDGLTIGHVVMPADPLGALIWQRFIVNEGGELDETTQWIPELLLTRELVPKPEPDDGPSSVTLGDSQLGGYDDSHGNIGDLGLYDRVSQFIERYPLVLKSYTKAELAPGMADMFAGQTARVGASDTSQGVLNHSIDKLRAGINADAERILKTRMGALGRGYSHAWWVDESTRLFREAYIACGVPKGIRLKQIVNLETLQRLASWFASRTSEEASHESEPVRPA
jgi:hypothetical protein